MAKYTIYPDIPNIYMASNTHSRLIVTQKPPKTQISDVHLQRHLQQRHISFRPSRPAIAQEVRGLSAVRLETTWVI